VLYIKRELDALTYESGRHIESPRQNVRYSPWSCGAGLKLSPTWHGTIICSEMNVSEIIAIAIIVLLL
jgi:hypothetical protein